MATVTLRSDSVLFSIGHLTFHEQEKIDYEKAVQLPTYKFVIERFYTIKRKLNEVNYKSSGIVEKAVYDLSLELEDAWIFCNVYPSSVPTIKKKVVQYIKSVDAVKKTAASRKESNNYISKVKTLEKQVKNGFDIRGTDKERIKTLTDRIKVKMTNVEDSFWKDNCVPNEVTGICERQSFSGNTDTKWYRASMKRYNRNKRIRSDKSEGTRRQEEASCSDGTDVEDDDEYISQSVSATLTPATSSMQTRSDQVATSCEHSDASTPNFETRTTNTVHPALKCRDGFRSMNPNLMVVLGLLVSKFGVSENKASECLQLVANSLFGQDLKLPSEDVIRMEVEEDDKEDPQPKKRIRKFGDLTYTLPSALTIHKWIEDQAILSVWHVADEIKCSRERDAVVTLGWDDTVKKAGHHRHDIKAGHVTIVEPDKSRTTYTTGLYENISHSGEDSAKTINMVMGSMAALTDVSKEELFSFIDFWINDRAGDNLVMLDKLGVEIEKRLFCNAHVLLTIDEAMDTAFRLTEVKAGKAKLISKDASHVFSTPQNSIFYLGLIALSKLLSDSHCTESISLYKDYKRFLKEQQEQGNEKVCEVLKEQFLGFQSNRFGRISYLSTVVLKHKELLHTFFDENVDENANKLVLACNSFLNSKCFFLCCEVSRKFGEILVSDIITALGIDKAKKVKSEYRSWKGMKTLFQDKLQMLSGMATSVAENNSAYDLLLRKCASLIHTNISRQLEYVQYFNENVSPSTELKLLQTPMTNDGCESELATCGESIKKVGSTVSLKTLSDRHMIVQNKLFTNEKWKCLPISEKRQHMKWARNSKEAKLVPEKGREYLEKVKAAQNLQLEVKAEKKKRKIQRSLALLEKLKRNGGPVTNDDIHRLNGMDTKTLLDQIAYLRCTIAPNIRQKFKKDGKFHLLSDEELRRQITDVIKPAEEIEGDLDSLVINALMQSEEIEETETHTDSGIGQIGVWKGTFERQCVGVLVTNDKLQLFRKVKTNYYKLGDLTEDPKDWELKEIIPMTDYSYVDYQGAILLKLHT